MTEPSTAPVAEPISAAARGPFGVRDELSHADFLDLLNEHRGELNAAMGIEITEASVERMTAVMPVEGNRQPFGLLHGGASAVLAETLGSTHAAMIAPDQTQPVGTELSCSHHRSATSGTVTARSAVLHSGRTMATFEIVVRDDEGRRICTARLSCYFRPLRPRPDTQP